MNSDIIASVEGNGNGSDLFPLIGVGFVGLSHPPPPPWMQKIRRKWTVEIFSRIYGGVQSLG